VVHYQGYSLRANDCTVFTQILCFTSTRGGKVHRNTKPPVASFDFERVWRECVRLNTTRAGCTSSGPHGVALPAYLGARFLRTVLRSMLMLIVPLSLCIFCIPAIVAHDPACPIYHYGVAPLWRPACIYLTSSPKQNQGQGSTRLD